jgi:hypothetical protein
LIDQDGWIFNSYRIQIDSRLTIYRNDTEINIFRKSNIFQGLCFSVKLLKVDIVIDLMHVDDRASSVLVLTFAACICELQHTNKVMEVPRMSLHVESLSDIAAVLFLV